MQRNVEYIQVVSVTVDESKFTEAFMQEFRESFYKFHTIEQHIKNLGQLFARGLVDDFSKEFIEGYGYVEEFGIKFKTIGSEVNMAD